MWTDIAADAYIVSDANNVSIVANILESYLTTQVIVIWWISISLSL